MAEEHLLSLFPYNHLQLLDSGWRAREVYCDVQ